MRSLAFLLTILTTGPALAHPGHVEASGGHSHWFELAVGGIVLVLAAGWLISRILRKSPVTDNG
jgi:hypothetical protein